MKTKSKSIIPVTYHSFGGAVFAGAVLLIAVSAQGQNLFVSDFQANKIYEFTPGGVKSTFASGLNEPMGLACDSAGNLYEADELGTTIYKFTPGGARSVFAGGLYEPFVLAFDSSGNLFEGDFGPVGSYTGLIHKFTPGGAQSTVASGSQPTGLAIDNAGNVFATDNLTASIYKYTPGGPNGTFVKSTFASGGAYHAYGLAFNSAGDLFESVYDYNLGNGIIYEFTPGGVRNTFASGLTDPEGLAFDSADNLFVADVGNIYEFTPAGARSTFASGLASAGWLAFQPVPEPSILGLLGVGAAAFLIRCRRWHWQKVSPESSPDEHWKSDRGALGEQ